jgi:tRNA A-37 threonylcarbamoyl transferase component Bud32
MNPDTAAPSVPETAPQVLVIDDSHALSTFVRFCLQCGLPAVRVVPYNAARGLPPREFAWDEYSVVAIRQELGRGLGTGRDWAQAVKLRRPDLPVVLCTTEADAEFVRNVARHEVDLCLDIMDTSPRLLVESVDRLLNPNALHRDNTLVDETILLETRRISDLERAETRVEPGTPQVPGYVNIRSLNSGAMGTIVLARRLEDDLEVILKFLSAKAIAEAELLQRFMREYEVIGRLENPHIVRVFDRGFAADFAYISMEHLPAGDLRTRLGTALAPARAIDFLRQMASGLGAAHEVGIVHRDLKPGNILFHDEDRLAISDFGIAKDLTTIRAVTLPGSFLGTPYYSRPEQLLGRQVDRRSDLYSLGVMLFQMLTGRRPYEGQSATDLADMHVNAPIPKLPPELRTYQSLVAGMMAKDPDDRFQSAAELVAGIEWCASQAASEATAA